jgi:hypothetical protein
VQYKINLLFFIAVFKFASRFVISKVLSPQCFERLRGGGLGSGKSVGERWISERKPNVTKKQPHRSEAAVSSFCFRTMGIASVLALLMVG